MNIIGKVLASRYEIIGKAGEGGMAVVYKAKDTLLNRHVAVKVLKDEFAADKVFVDRFKKEAQSAAALAHPNIVSVYDVGTEEGINYIVMELLTSRNLKDYIEEKGRLSVDEVLKISLQIASALQAAHKAHIVHRDIKPQNITLDENLGAKVTDFGIAKITNVSSATITNFGATVGSVHYFSPEHAKGGYTDEKSDIYSLGVVMYEMATGKLPFDGDTPVAVALKHIQEEPIEPKEINPAIPDYLNDIILKAMAKNTAIRYQSANAILEDINDAIDLRHSNKRNNLEAGKTQVINLDSELNNGKVPNLRTREPRRIANQNGVKQRDFEEKYKENPKDSINKKSKKNKKVLLIYIIVMAVIVLVFGIIFIPKLTKKFGGSNKQKVEYQVPDLVGKKLSEVQETYKEQGIIISQSGVEYSKDVEEGSIISQDQNPGSNSTIYTINVVVSKGTRMVSVPDVEGKDLKVATYELQDSAGFVIETVEEVNEKVAKGLIFSQEPKAGESVAYGSTIKLKISLGDGKKAVLMPSVIGKTLADAKKELEDLKLAVNIKYGEDKSKSNGVVIAQNYPQNQELKEGDLAEITINKLILTKKVTLSLAEYTKDVFTEENTTAKFKVMASVDGGAYNAVSVPSSITKKDTEVSFELNGYETAVVQIFIDEKMVGQKNIDLAK